MSEALKQVDDIDWIRKRTNLPRTSATFAFNQLASNIEQGIRVQEMSNLQDWFGGRRTIEMAEDVVGLGRYGKTLTVLYDIDLPEPEEEEDEENMIES